MPLATVEEALHDYAAGKFIIVVDDEDRENEGDLVCAAQFVTAEHIAFMAREGRGLICLALEGRRLDELQIPLMVGSNTSRLGTNFTVSIEAAHGVTTGISAADRAHTIRTVLDPRTTPADIARPGHVFPLRAAEGGVLQRAGHTEAAVDLARLAGLYPAGVICEIMNDDGTMARMPQLEDFARRHGIKIISIAQIIAYRRMRETIVRPVGRATLPTVWGVFQAVSYESLYDPSESIALVMGDVQRDEPVLVRVHSECLTGDVFGSLRCDCGAQLRAAMQRIARAGRGVLLYLRQEGRGIGLHNKLRAYALQEQGADTVEANIQLGFPADLRDYGIGAQILIDLGVRRLRLLTNNPKKLHGLQGYGLEIVEQIPLVTPPTPFNRRYLQTKREKLGHLLEVV
ncbi:MAG: bifunctional 3,4-dihydroxy-2-butanone-4-phosphate synthase/GTP cyclohydrolase II [Roseiflexus sp.]|nr:bifunctional 3,4-dihydroxy-2-butanone-4-phosphate synthase/GTP cyclohydrolase II [Roseiflexus sp.]MCS7290710.1 bifunctional 3,4-dihydroxy-2-butanone-4-phosphate synthase/GTP cyclohydrolase II [Roseiflexus sp.]MDW8148415.1 bifunctional 3,4-dihydroxy-2-butanone-4-phosphate synthase/GTP cyclohydrolase II [Roseiflexaceae bacterium]MDW8232688.1 bifunctional 3,4-dihydroxy-2-butanone-4-phosphate synthase/GTP cyclohydrolase II [Roseiflexaceae bacterium]